MPVRRRRWTSSEKREVGARQGWKCAHCKTSLPATYEIDHITPLHDGGADCLESNAEALCNQCHAKKTLRERIQMERRRTEAILKAKDDAKLVVDTSCLRPARHSRTVLDAEQGIDDFFENRFLRFAYVKKSN